MDTEMGKIANMLDNEEEGQTPLQEKLADLGKKLGMLALVACAIIFVVGLVNGISALEIFMTAVSLAVSAIPEGLPAIVTIVLAAHRNGMPKDALNKLYPRLAEIPFDSDRKLMTTVNLVDGKNLVIVKGAFDVMMPRL